jgi:hypothetical protein
MYNSTFKLENVGKKTLRICTKSLGKLYSLLHSLSKCHIQLDTCKKRNERFLYRKLSSCQPKVVAYIETPAKKEHPQDKKKLIKAQTNDKKTCEHQFGRDDTRTKNSTWSWYKNLERYNFPLQFSKA